MILRPLLSAIQDLLNETDRAIKHVEILSISNVKSDLIKYSETDLTMTEIFNHANVVAVLMLASAISIQQ
jgi:hypothetical protein